MGITSIIIVLSPLVYSLVGLIYIIKEWNNLDLSWKEIAKYTAASLIMLLLASVLSVASIITGKELWRFFAPLYFISLFIATFMPLYILDKHTRNKKNTEYVHSGECIAVPYFCAIEKDLDKIGYPYMVITRKVCNGNNCMWISNMGTASSVEPTRLGSSLRW